MSLYCTQVNQALYRRHPQHNIATSDGSTAQMTGMVCVPEIFLSRITKVKPFLIQDCASRGNSQTTETVLEIGGDYSIVFKTGQN